MLTLLGGAGAFIFPRQDLALFTQGRNKGARCQCQYLQGSTPVPSGKTFRGPLSPAYSHRTQVPPVGCVLKLTGGLFYYFLLSRAGNVRRSCGTARDHSGVRGSVWIASDGMK